MNIPQDIFNALKSLVGDRVYPDEFRQNDKGELVGLPQIRYTFAGGEVFSDLCGVIADDGNPRVQFDVVHQTGTGRDALVALVHSALDALSDPPCVLDGLPINQRDPETKLYRATFDYVFQPTN